MANMEKEDLAISTVFHNALVNDTKRRNSLFEAFGPNTTWMCLNKVLIGVANNSKT